MTMPITEATNNPCLFGEVLFDRFPDGAEVLGGAPFNVAWHLQALGCDPLFISAVGDDVLGRKVSTSMQQWGMNTTGLQVDSNYPTGTVDISLSNGEPDFDIVAGCAYDHIASTKLPGQQPGLIYHGSLAIREDESRNTLASLIQSTNAPVFIDVNLRNPWWQPADVIESLSAARWAKLNNHELAELAAIDGDLLAQAEDTRSRYGLEQLIITLGKDGAFAIGPQGPTPQIRPTEIDKLVDTVGAGDGFASICILGILHNWDIMTMLERAQYFASAIVGIRGATPHNTDFYQRFIQQWNLA